MSIFIDTYEWEGKVYVRAFDTEEPVSIPVAGKLYQIDPPPSLMTYGKPSRFGTDLICGLILGLTFGFLWWCFR